MPPSKLDLHIRISAQGLGVSAFGVTLAADCQQHAPGVTFQRASDGSLDFAALARCARALKSRSPEETEVHITADRAVAYRELVAVLDSVRSDMAGELFPEAAIAADSPAPAATSALKPDASGPARP